MVIAKNIKRETIQRLKEKKESYLTNTDLILALISLTSGKIDKERTEKLLQIINQKGLRIIVELDVKEIEELTNTKTANIIKIMQEIMKRIAKEKSEKKAKITSPRDVADYLMEDLRYLKQENVVVLFLNVKNRIIGQKTVYIGSLSSSILSPREIFIEALKHNAASIIVVHNHPSGDPEPSSGDINITKKLKEAGKTIGIDLLDHIIIGDGVYCSLAEKGII